ncbi:MAG TPA: sigma-70 family RNA polymerase sigma factor, partial [Acidimicrobiia bacterium]|nr:sigma-70 family RNA polymerase sigma factor [Acidimicrobiia bacterium]
MARASVLTAEPPRPAARGRTHSAAAVSDPVGSYLDEIGRVPLLTGAQERELAERIGDGVKAEALGSREELDLPAIAALARARLGPVAVADLTPERALELCRRLQRDGLAARAALIEANLRLVVSIAKRYRGKGMQLLDLIQDGNLGLIRAVERFDPSRGFKFSTYATWWIKQNISRALADRDRVVRLPVHVVNSVAAIKRLQRDLVQDLGRQPKVEDLAAELGIGVEEVKRLLTYCKETLSLDVPIGEQARSHLGDYIPDEGAEEPPEAAVEVMMREQVGSALGALSKTERSVIELRYGLSDDVQRTLDEAGAIVGLTRERVYRIERRALCKLRHPCTAHTLR